MTLIDAPVLSDVELNQSFSENSYTVLRKRYLRKGPDGEPIETPAEMFRRVAHHVAQGELEGRAAEAEEFFYRLLTTLRFVPNSPTFTGAGTPLGQLAACFVLPLEDDMGRFPGGIFQSLRDAALIQQTGGGNGFSFSRLRPRDALVVSSMGKATGPIGFLRVYDKAFGEIAQGGSRRGANMATLRVDHPDIEDFIGCKTDEKAINNFNISVGVLDAFMQAVEQDAEWELRFPDVNHPHYRNFRGTLEDAAEVGLPIPVYRKVKARELFERCVKQAWRNGEPGMLFLDAAQRGNPTPNMGKYESTNPCGEQFLLPNESCCLGSLNLARHLKRTEEGQPAVDWEKLAESAIVATRFLDDVVSVNSYVPAVPLLKETAQRARRIGLGIMGLADLLYHMGVRYGSPEGQELAAQVMEFVRYHAMQASIALAEERGPFPAIEGSVYDPKFLRWNPPVWPEWLDKGPQHDWGRPALNWESVMDGLRAHGIRNATQLTVAPTGTIATVVGTEGYGCEPVFALAYTRQVIDEGHPLTLRYSSPAFMQALTAAGLDETARERILQQVAISGSCQDVTEVPAALRTVFVTAADVPAEGHIRMQAALQLFTDASISKTINFPASARPDDVREAFLLAWRLGCKGLTVYVAGSRESEVLQTEATRQQKQAPEPPVAAPAAVPDWPTQTMRPRPQCLAGRTYRIPTPLGTAYVTLNLNGHNQPFEVFLNVGKAGSDTAAVAEAIGRLISLILRMPSAWPPRERLEVVAGQLESIGGGRPLGFGHKRVLSLPDGVSRILREYLDEGAAEDVEPSGRAPLAPPKPAPEAKVKVAPAAQIGDLCPSCGQATMVYTEGCRRCYACGHSEC